MKVLVVFAHPEPRSFNGQMRDAAVETLTAAGHEVQQSDLYAMRFKPAVDAEDIEPPFDDDFFHVQRMQDLGARERRFSPDLVAEMEKLEWADLVIFQFPLWWQSVPAILKGWFDRVLARGFAYDRERAYDTAPLQGRRALLSITTGASAASMQPGGFYDRDITEIIRHILHGTLLYVGLEPLPSFIAWQAAKVGAERERQYLEEWRALLRSL